MRSFFFMGGIFRSQKYHLVLKVVLKRFRKRKKKKEIQLNIFSKKNVQYLI